MKMTDSSYQSLGDRIVLIKKAVSNPELLIKIAEESAWTENHSQGYSDNKTRRYETSIEITATSTTNIEFLRELQGALDTYASILGSKVDISARSIFIESSELDGISWDFHISKYTEGGLVSSHTDEDYSEDLGIYSIILYLNDDYASGEVGFNDYGVEIKPSAGDVLIFPCHYWHYSNAVSGGDKYMSIFRLRF